MTPLYYDPFGGFGAFFGIIIFISLASCILQIVIAVWVYNDAKKRNMEPTMWLAITLLAGCIGCIIYLVLREPIPTEIAPISRESHDYDNTISYGNNTFCTNCGNEIPAGAKYCPSCGTHR